MIRTLKVIKAWYPNWPTLQIKAIKFVTLSNIAMNPWLQNFVIKYKVWQMRLNLILINKSKVSRIFEHYLIHNPSNIIINIVIYLFPLLSLPLSLSLPSLLFYAPLSLFNQKISHFNIIHLMTITYEPSILCTLTKKKLR